MRIVRRFINLCVIFIGGLCLLSGQACVAQSSPGLLQPKNGNLANQPWEGTIVHRGLYQIYQNVVPENSVAAIKNAILKGFSGVEIDVRLSKDHVPIVIHDKLLNRSINDCNYVYRAIDNFNSGCDAKSPDGSSSLVAFPVSKYRASTITDTYFHSGYTLYAYGQNAELQKTGNTLKTLQSLIYDIGPSLANNPNFSIILDVQNYATVSAAARVVEGSRYKNQIFLKFY